MTENEEKELERSIREAARMTPRQMRARVFKRIVLRVEIVIGIIAMLAGAGLTILVWNEGYFVGALMLVMTGLINTFLAVKELSNPTDHIFHWPAIFFLIVRRTIFILNVVLIALVVGTMTRLI